MLWSEEDMLERVMDGIIKGTAQTLFRIAPTKAMKGMSSSAYEAEEKAVKQAMDRGVT